MPSKGRILHVEDNADNRHLVRRVQELEGYEVIEAANGTQALEFLDSLPVAWRCWTRCATGTTRAGGKREPIAGL
jgi:CheY-like chemotaxis protein